MGSRISSITFRAGRIMYLALAARTRKCTVSQNYFLSKTYEALGSRSHVLIVRRRTGVQPYAHEIPYCTTHCFPRYNGLQSWGRRLRDPAGLPKIFPQLRLEGRSMTAGASWCSRPLTPASMRCWPWRRTSHVRPPAPPNPTAEAGQSTRRPLYYNV